MPGDDRRCALRPLRGIERLKDIKVAESFDPPWVKEQMFQGAMLELGKNL